MHSPNHWMMIAGILAYATAAFAQESGTSQPASAPARDWSPILKGLASENFAEREAAQQALEQVPEEEIDQVRLLAQAQKDEEVKARLQARVAQMLVTMDNYFSSGDAKNAKGDWKGAVSDYTKSLKRQPDYYLAYLGRANARDDSGDAAGAMADYDKAIALNANFAPSYMNRGIAKARQGDLDGALQDYNTAVRFAPRDADIYFYRAMAFQKTNDFDNAIADYSRSLQFRPQQVEGYFYRGVLQQIKGNEQDALTDFAAALARNPSRADAHYYMGMIQYNKQAWARAVADLRQELEINASNDCARTWLWLARSRQGDQAAATLELREYLDGRKDAKPDDWELNVCKFMAGRLKEEELLKAAANSDKTLDAQRHCEAWFYAGSLRLLAGDKTAATADFEKSVATGMLVGCYQSAQVELKRLKSGAPASGGGG